MRVSRMGLRLGVVALAWAVVAPSSPAAAGDISVRAGAYTDAEAAFVGIEYRTAVSGRLHAAPNFEIAFPSNGSLFSFNGDLHYVFPSKGKLIGWAGGGLGLGGGPDGEDGDQRREQEGANRAKHGHRLAPSKYSTINREMCPIRSSASPY